MFRGNYAIYEMDGEGDPVEVSSDTELVSSDTELRDHLRNRGLTDQQISKAMEDLKAAPRKIRLAVNP